LRKTQQASAVFLPVQVCAPPHTHELAMLAVTENSPHDVMPTNGSEDTTYFISAWSISLFFLKFYHSHTELLTHTHFFVCTDFTRGSGVMKTSTVADCAD